MTNELAKLVDWFDNSVGVNSNVELAVIIKTLGHALVPVWHPLGFIHAKLGQCENGDTFRLHVWSSQDRDGLEQAEKIHDHLFNIESRVVFGGVGNIQYKFYPDAGGTHRVLRVRYASSQSSLVETGVFGNLIVVSDDSYVEHDRYSVKQFDVHESKVLYPGLALTVVRTTAAAKYEPRAFFLRDSPTPSARTPVSCDRTLWLNLLAKMLPM